MSENEQTYFNFPVKMMQNILMSDSETRKDFLNNVLYYHIQKHAEKIRDLNEYDETETQLFKRSADYWDVNLNSGAEAKMKQGKSLIRNYADAKVFTGIGRTIFWDYYSNLKTDFDWQCLFAYLALKSIIGKKRYCKTDNTLMFARMAGFEAKNDYSEIAGFGFTEYHRNKIISKLETDWYLKYYSRYTRGFYVGLDISLQNLIFEAESRRDQIKKELIKNEKAEILKQWQNSIR